MMDLVIFEFVITYKQIIFYNNNLNKLLDNYKIKKIIIGRDTYISFNSGGVTKASPPFEPLRGGKLLIILYKLSLI